MILTIFLAGVNHHRMQGVQDVLDGFLGSCVKIDVLLLEVGRVVT